MRKKLFAVIMSAMMMVTFMPAMAFAALDDPTRTEAAAGWHVAPFAGVAKTPADEFTYDGQEHEVTYVAATDATKLNRTISYSATGTVLGKAWNYAASATAPKIKDAGTYYINAEGTYYVKETTYKYVVKENAPAGFKVNGHPYSAGQTISDDDVKAKKEKNEWYQVAPYVTEIALEKMAKKTEDFGTLKLTINPRQVLVGAKGSTTLLKQKVYDGKGVALTDADLNISPLLNSKTNAYDAPNTGLVAGDTLFTETVVSPAEVGVYFLKGFAMDKMNKNYAIVSSTASTRTEIFNGLFVQITKATPVVKITSNEFVIKSGKSAKVKYTTNLGTAKLTKTSGNAKITLSNGKLKVKKGLKKGTYKVTVKAAVAESNNWNAAKRVKKLTVVVK